MGSGRHDYGHHVKYKTGDVVWHPQLGNARWTVVVVDDISKGWRGDIIIINFVVVVVVVRYTILHEMDAIPDEQ